MPVPGLLVWSTNLVDGRPRVLHLRRSSASWLNGQHIGHCDEKRRGLNKNKLVPWQRPLSDRNPILQQLSVPVWLPILKIRRRSAACIWGNSARMICKNRKQLGSSKVIKVEPFDRSHTTSYSTSKATTPCPNKCPPFIFLNNSVKN